MKIGVFADVKTFEMVKRCLVDDLRLDSDNILSYYLNSKKMFEALTDGRKVPDVVLVKVDDSFNIVEKILTMSTSVEIIIIAPSCVNVCNIIIDRVYAILINPVSYYSLRNVIWIYMKERGLTDNMITVTFNKEPYRIQLDNVYYFESRKRIIHVHGLENEVSFYMTIKNLENILSGKGFVRCHRSYLVNERYIEEIHREYLVVKGEKISVGRLYYEQRDGYLWNKLHR